MPFITQGKANIKYLLIVVFVAAVAGGIIFFCWKNYQKEIVNLNNFTEIKNLEKNIEEKISDNGLKVIIKTSDNQYYLILVENGKEKIIDSCLVKYVSKKIEDLEKLCSYYNLSLSPQKNYLIYSKSGFEWSNVFLYNIKTEEIKKFSDAHTVGFTDDEKYLFACAYDGFSGTYYGKVYDNKSFGEVYNTPEEYSYIEQCGYDSDRKVVFFKSVNGFPAIWEKKVYVIIDYNPETNKANIINYISTSTPATNTTDTVISTDGKLSAYQTDNSNNCELHIINNATRQDKIIYQWDSPCPEMCFIDSLSPNGNYLVYNCGTSPQRGMSIININSGKESASFSLLGEYFWLNNEEILANEPEPVSSWYSMCTSGDETGIIKVNAVSGKITVLKKADSSRSYYLREFLNDGTISYSVANLPPKSTSGFNCYQEPTSTDWIMDVNGNTIKQINADSLE